MWTRRIVSVTFPASMLVAAMNPCFCGYSGNERHPCTCTPAQIQRYRRKVSVSLKETKEILETAMDKLGLSARAYSRILKVSRTIADLESSPDIQAHHISEAVQYRMMDRGVF